MPVEVDRCPIVAAPLPLKPMREIVVCAATFGEGSVCYGPTEAHRLAAFLDVLIDVYQDVAACNEASP